MNKRNSSEDRVYQLLLEIGYSMDLIDEPDKTGQANPDKAVDFTIPDLAIEVKELTNAAEEAEANRVEQDIEKDGYSVFLQPNVNDRVHTHLSSTSLKLDNHPNVQSMLIVDISKWIFPPDIEKVVQGEEVVEVLFNSENPSESFKETDRAWFGKLFQDETKFTCIGAIGFLGKSSFKIYHNLMASKERRLSLHRACDLSNISSLVVQQFAFYNINKGPSIVRRIEII